MRDIKRISPETVMTDVQSGDALLICAYDNDEKYEKMHLEGSIPLSRFKAEAAGIPKDRQLVFF